MEESMKGFFGEFHRSWGWKICKWTLVVVLFLLILLYSSSLIFDDSSMYFLKNKHEYTFKIVEITVSIFAFVGLIWSITYQREELLQSRKELQQSREDLKAQSENVNRSIDEANKNFDRELLFELYRSINNDLVIGELAFIYNIYWIKCEVGKKEIDEAKILSDIKRCNTDLIPHFEIRQSLSDFIAMVDTCKILNKGVVINNVIRHELFDSDSGELLHKRFSQFLGKLEYSVLILLYDMLRYAEEKNISLNEPVFSLTKHVLRSCDFFMKYNFGYRLTREGVRSALLDCGIISQSEDPLVFIGLDGFLDFLVSLDKLKIVDNIDDFRDYILGVGE